MTPLRRGGERRYMSSLHKYGERYQGKWGVEEEEEEEEEEVITAADEDPEE